MSNVKVLAERQVPDEGQVAAVEVQKATVPQSSASSDHSRHMVLMLEEIRRVLNARMGALLAMGAAFILTVGAMAIGTWMALAMAMSFDIFALIPILIIAYRTPKG